MSVASTSIRAQCIRASDQLSNSILLISPTFRHGLIDTQWCHHHVWVSIRTWRVFATTLGTLDSTSMFNFVTLTNQLLICCFMFRLLRFSFLLRYQTIWLFVLLLFASHNVRAYSLSFKDWMGGFDSIDIDGNNPVKIIWIEHGIKLSSNVEKAKII